MKMLQWQPSGDHVRSCCVTHLHMDSVCGEVMGVCSMPEVRFFTPSATYQHCK